MVTIYHQFRSNNFLYALYFRRNAAKLNADSRSRSSDYKTTDQEVVDAVNKAAPFAKWPTERKDNRFEQFEREILFVHTFLGKE